MKKLKLNREAIRNLASADLRRIAGGAAPNPTAGQLCNNTDAVCVDTEANTNCLCGPASQICNTAQCHQFTFTC